MEKYDEKTFRKLIRELEKNDYQIKSKFIIIILRGSEIHDNFSI